MADPVLIVGLGNPGPQYESTRHNVGFMVLDAVADSIDATFKQSQWKAAIAEGRIGDTRVILVKPSTFMNLSGESVGPISKYFKVDPVDLIVVHDEVDLPVCELRAKRGGGAGGHNGIRSLVQHLGTGEFVRVRFGVGRPPGRKDTAVHVLEPFNEKEWDDVAPTIAVAAETVADLARRGLESVEQEKAQQAPSSKRIKLAVTVAEPIEAVWNRFTTVEGVTSFFGPDARVGSSKGDPYEIFFDIPASDGGSEGARVEGARGNEGGVIVTADAPKRLSFTWNAPPDIPRLRASKERTRVSLTFKRKSSSATMVTLTHTGFGEGPDHDANHAYFEKAWPIVLSRLEGVCAGGVMDWSTGTVVPAPDPE